MQLRNTAILAILFAALGAYLYFVELPRNTDEDGTSPALSFEQASVSRIELEHPGRKVVLLKQDGKWEMIEPVDASADERNVDNLLKAVEECEIKRTLEETDDLARYGLDFPSATVRLLSGEDVLGIIKVGKKTPVGGSAYILRNEESAVHLTNAAFVDRIDRKATDLRDKTVLDFDKAEVVSLELRGRRGEVTLRKDDDRWSIVAPADYPADGSQVGNLLSTLESLRANHFVAEDEENLARFGLARPRTKVTLGFVDGDPLELRVGSEREGKLRVQTNRRSTVYAIASWAMDSLDKGVDDFRDKTIARFAPEDAGEIEIESGDGLRIGLKKSAEGWESVADEIGVKQAVVEELLGELSSLHGFEIAADSPDSLSDFGLDPPHRSLRVHDADGELLAAVGIGSHAVDGAQIEYSAIAEGSTTVFHIRELAYERINKGKTLFEQPERSESAAPPVPDGETGDGIDDEPLDDAATAGEEG